MPFINTAGLTILGDGSQWFWSMLAFWAVPITGFVIYSQLRIAQSVRAREQVDGLDRDLDSERSVCYQLEVLSAVRDDVDPPDFVRGFWRRRPDSNR